jgi:sideroflexin-5
MPANLPISAGMLLSPPGAWQLVFQWLNQSYNAGFNYANRNASVPLDTTQLATSYAVATGTAVGAAFGLGRVVQRMQARVSAGGGKPTLGLKLLTRGLPWLAVATAGAANAVAMRYKEGM